MIAPGSMDLRLVAPVSSTSDNNAALLSRLKNYKPSFPSTFSSDTLIPVASNLDVDGIIRQNDKHTQRGQGLAAAHDATDALDDGAEEAVDDPLEEDPPSWRTLEQLVPTNRLEQINTVFLQDFPSVRKLALVRCLELFLSLCPVDAPKDFQFTFVSETLKRDLRGVFVRFVALEVTRWAKQNVGEVFPTVIAAFDAELDVTGVEKVSASSKLALVAELDKIFANKRNYIHGSKSTGTEDLDEVMKYYRTYKVDNSELVEVPKELIETIVKDILMFRSKVLTIERERRKREVEKERRRARHRLTLIYEGIKAAHGTVEEDDMDTDDAVPDDKLATLTDLEYEAYLSREKAAKEEALWQQQLHELERLETQEKAPLLRRLEQELAYEDALVENKIAHMDEIKVLLELDVVSAEKCTNRKAKLYFTNAEYMRLRKPERTREAERDRVDAESETHPGAASAAFVALIKPASKPPKPEPQRHADASIDADSGEKVPIVSALPPQLLVALKEHIGALVEKYLGIKEELLTEFIYDFVVEKNTSAADELVAELQETLDEDSHTVVEKLHAYIRGLGKPSPTEEKLL